MKVLLKNGDVYTPNRIGKHDILIENGIIKQISNNINKQIKSIDCSNCIICPMFVDGHAHLSLNKIYSHKDIIRSGIGTVVGMLSMVAYEEDFTTLLKICTKLNRKGINAFCLTGAFKYYGDISSDIITIPNVIGTKTALNSKTKIRPESPTLQELSDIAEKTYHAGILTEKHTQLHIHLESTKANSIQNLYDAIQDREVGNLFWIDAIVNTKQLPYSLFKLTHAQKYLNKIFEYAEKGCYIDYTAMHNNYDIRFDELIKVLKNPLYDKSKFSISSDAGSFGLKKGQFLSLLNTLKILVNEKGIDLKDALPLFTSNPGKLIDDHSGKLINNCPAKILILDNTLNIKKIICRNKIINLK